MADTEGQQESAPKGGEWSGGKSAESELLGFELFGKEVGLKIEHAPASGEEAASTAVSGEMDIGKVEMPKGGLKEEHRIDLPVPGMPFLQAVIDLGAGGSFTMGAKASAKGERKTDGETTVEVAGTGYIEAAAYVSLGAGLAAGIPKVAQLSATVEGVPKISGKVEYGIKGTLKKDKDGKWSGSLSFPITYEGELSAEVFFKITGMLSLGFAKWKKDLVKLSLGKWVVGTCGFATDIGVHWPGPKITGEVTEPYFKWGDKPKATPLD